MYQTVIGAVIGDVEDEEGMGWDFLETIVSNGVYARRPNGDKLGLSRRWQGITCLFGSKKKPSIYRVKDQILVARIISYITNYFGKYPTNCATFAHFLM